MTQATTPRRSRDAFDRLPVETPVAWEAFTVYRDMGPQRSVRKTAEQLGRGARQVAEWSSKHQWVYRAAEWDDAQDRLWLKDMAVERRRTAEAHMKIARAVQAKVVDRLRTIDPDKLSPRDLAYWFDVATRVEREALGVPQRHEVSGPDGRPIEIEQGLPDDELEILAELSAIASAIAERAGFDHDDEIPPTLRRVINGQ